MVLFCAITLIGFVFKFFKVNGGSAIQLLSFLIISVLSFRFAFHFYRDRRNRISKKTIAVLFGAIGILLPSVYIVFMFLPEYSNLATQLNIITYLLISLTVLFYLKTYQGLNIFRISKETRKTDLALIYINSTLAILSLTLYIGDFQTAMPYLLYAIVGVNATFGTFLVINYKFTNRLTSMLIASVLTMHIYHLPYLIHHI